MAVAALAERTDIPAEVALLADAVLELYRRIGPYVPADCKRSSRSKS
jgi:hypothetical protein